MTAPSPPISGYESARLRIAHLKIADDRGLEAAIARAVSISAAMLDVARVGVWMLSEDRRFLTPLYVVGRESGEGEQPALEDLPLHAWPRYAAAIDERRVIAATDALTDARTSELSEGYFRAHHVASTLDVPIFVASEVWGIVCHEHVGSARAWTEREIDFGISVADMLTALFEQAARLGAERELRARDAADATERKNSALVQLGAGVAHDFNTVLQTILLLSSAATTSTAGEQRSSLEQINEECARGARVVRQLLDFAQSVTRPLVALDLARLVKEARPSVEALLGEHARLELRAFREVVVAGDQALLERAMMNLVVNARDAMPNGGTLRISVTVDGDYGVLAVSDEGEGVPEHVRERMFEPFYTTKTERGGTGLGLATVAVVCEQHAGSVSVDSGGKQGTTVSLRIPLLR